MIVGIRQPTATTVELSGGTATAYQNFGTDNDYGDGTVPLTGAVGLGEALDTNLAVRVPEQHTNLQCNQFVLDQVQEILTAQPVRRRELKSVSVRASVPDLVTQGQDSRWPSTSRPTTPSRPAEGAGHRDGAQRQGQGARHGAAHAPRRSRRHDLRGPAARHAHGDGRRVGAVVVRPPDHLDGRRLAEPRHLILT